ncbi:hypothetical protein LMG24235_04476 [Paraburkholderia sabiae]|nr:hypothetical protein LMG24235_04476 [Paraburkholderia sabiae]
MPGVWIRQADAGPTVVFVHGVLSSGASCWKDEASGTFWPDLVANTDQIPDLGVYVSTYRTGLDSGTYSINDAASAVFEELRLDRVLDHELIVFVCHSMGGLVIRRMLVQRIDELAGKQVSVFLVATPSLGSIYANWVRPIARFFKHAQAESMRLGEDNQWLESLDDDFIDLVYKHEIAGRELYEDISIFSTGMFSLAPVVSPLSARRYFRDPLKIPGSNHFTIGKPKDDQELQHRVLIEFIHQRQQAWEMRAAASASATTGKAKVPSASDLLAHDNLADYLLAANEIALGRLVEAVPPGAAVRSDFVRERFRHQYLAATDGADIHDRVGAASALVNDLYPEYNGRFHLVSVTGGELAPIVAPPQTVLQSALSASKLKGPRMMAAMIAEAPMPAIRAARDEIDAMLRSLLKGEAG